MITSDGSTASYYEIPKGAAELQDLISHRDMNAQVGEIFRACYRYGMVSHSPKKRDIKKIIFYAQAELARLEKLEVTNASSQEEESVGDAATRPVQGADHNTDSKVVRVQGQGVCGCPAPNR